MPLVIISSILFSLTIINHNLNTTNALSLQNYVLLETEKTCFIEYLNSEDDGAPQHTFIEELKPFYVNLRDQIVNPNGSLYELKKEFDSLSKKEKEDILERYR